ncbi:MAG: Phytochelatin synthase [Rhodobacteraceae bacterium HLUCCA12]|nr:MAG: Phytochelatin synthase [Rhodobacteraceae bacterium HLUCCA12]
MLRSILAGLTCLTLSLAPAQADELIYLTDEPGEALFFESEERSDYFALASYLETEQILTFCGPATIATVLNSLEVERPAPRELYPWRLWTQDMVFTPENQEVKPYAMVEHEGLVLEDLATFFRNLGVSAEYRHADTFDTDELRQIVVDTLAAPDQRLVVNYSRQPINQSGGGHISPVAAYDADSDRVLILDVARYKYPPVWLTLDDLLTAMRDVDPDSDEARGLVVVSE